MCEKKIGIYARKMVVTSDLVQQKYKTRLTDVKTEILIISQQRGTNNEWYF